jgi:hypothetical protein
MMKTIIRSLKMTLLVSLLLPAAIRAFSVGKNSGGLLAPGTSTQWEV